MPPVNQASSPLPPMPHNLPLGYVPEPPRKNRAGKIAASIVALLVLGGGGFAAYLFLQQGPANKQAITFAQDDLRTGSYWLVNACNVFTAKDFDDLTGKRTDHSMVSTDFVAKTYNDTQANRAYRTNCTRTEAPNNELNTRLMADVTVHQYPDATRTDAQLAVFGLNGATIDTELGGRARFGMPKLSFEVGNKVVSVVIQGYGGLSDSDVEAKAREIAKKVAAKLREPNQKPLGVLFYPAKFVAPGFTYHNACTLWGPDDFTALYGEVDQAEIKMDFAEDIIAAEEVQGMDKSTKAKCTMGSYTTDPGDLAGKDYAYVEIDYYRTKEAAEAAYAQYVRSDDEQVSGIGEAAVLQQKQRLMVRRGATLVRVQFIPNDLSEKAKAEEGVRAMARTILDRLN